MSTSSVSLPARDFSGSRFRCLLLTHQPPEEVARLLTALVQPFAVVRPRDVWMPRGFLAPAEAKLGEAPHFLSDAQRRVLTDWWLAVPAHANTPNWDIASTCLVDDLSGLLLVEAKAHSNELSHAGKAEGNADNDGRIRAALAQANAALSEYIPGWHLSADSHYQLSNRFAWAWKIASLGVPVILLYLGFLGGAEMAGAGQPFRSYRQWEDALLGYSAGVVPASAWNRSITTAGAPLCALIRALDLHWSPAGPGLGD